jgi:hypothetical protein
LFLKKGREAGFKLFKFINVKNKRTKYLYVGTFEVFTMLANPKDPIVEYDYFKIFFMLFTFSLTQKVLDPVECGSGSKILEA